MLTGAGLLSGHHRGDSQLLRAAKAAVEAKPKHAKDGGIIYV